MITLRGYQEKAVDGVRVEYGKGKKCVILVMPTGAGKTVVFSHITRITAANNKRVLILAHRRELLTQCGDKLKNNDVDFGYLNPAFTPSPLFRVQVGTMQTVVKRMLVMNFVPDLIIIDECHRSMGKTYQDILKFYPAARVLGVTATPVRGDGKPLGEYFESMVLGPSIKELIAMGALVPPRTFGPARFLDLSKVDVVKQEDGSYDYNRKQVEDIIDKPGVTDDAVKRYREICPGAAAVVFCVSIQHAYHVAENFKNDGWNFKPVHGNSPNYPMTDLERDTILRELKDGTIHGIVSVDLVTEGFDAPNLQVAIMLRPTQSEGLYLQMAGRVLRSWPGKVCAFILDHAGCVLMHGLVTMNRVWSLDVATPKKKRKKSDRLLSYITTQCPKCFLTHEPEPKCPNCGYVYVVEGNMPSQKRGQIIEITEQQGEFIDFLQLIKSPKQIREDISKAKSFDDLRIIERTNGYKQGWAKKVWAHRNKKAGIT